MGTREKGGSSSPGPGILHIEGMGEGGKRAKKMMSLPRVQNREGDGEGDRCTWVESQRGEPHQFIADSEIAACILEFSYVPSSPSHLLNVYVIKFYQASLQGIFFFMVNWSSIKFCCQLNNNTNGI